MFSRTLLLTFCPLIFFARAQSISLQVSGIPATATQNSRSSRPRQPHSAGPRLPDHRRRHRHNHFPDWRLCRRTLPRARHRVPGLWAPGPPSCAAAKSPASARWRAPHHHGANHPQRLHRHRRCGQPHLRQPRIGPSTFGASVLDPGDATGDISGSSLSSSVLSFAANLRRQLPAGLAHAPGRRQLPRQRQHHTTLFPGPSSTTSSSLTALAFNGPPPAPNRRSSTIPTSKPRRACCRSPLRSAPASLSPSARFRPLPPR